MDFLQEQYNKSEIIKDILYMYIKDNNLHDDKYMISKCVVNDKHITSNNTSYDNEVISNNIYNDNNMVSKLSSSDNKFEIDLNNIEDNEIEVEAPNVTDVTNNALDFMLNM